MCDCRRVGSKGDRQGLLTVPRWPSPKVCDQVYSVAALQNTVVTVFWLAPTLVSVWHVQSYCRRPRMGLKELDRLAIPG